MDWRFSTYVLILLGMLVGITWATSETGLCSSEYVVGVLRDHTKDGALNCFDFWLNRYQTLIGALIALAAALIALLPARGQLKEMRRQSAASARQSAIEQARDLETEIAAYGTASSIYFRMRRRLNEYDNFSWNSIYQEWPDLWKEIIVDIRSVRDRSISFSGRYPDFDEIWLARINILTASSRLFVSSHELADVFRRSTFPDYEEGDEDVNEEESARVRSEVDMALTEFEKSREETVERLSGMLREAWREVRSLDKNALGR